MSAKRATKNTQKQPAHGGCSASPCSALPDELDALVIHMRDVAAKMDYYGGFNVEIRQHAKELDGAANIARGWAKGMRAGKINPTGSGHLYRCSDCRRTYWRESAKAWIKSYCLRTGKAARLVRMPNKALSKLCKVSPDQSSLP